MRGGEVCRRLLSLRLPAAPIGLPPSHCRAAAVTGPLGPRVSRRDALARPAPRLAMLGGGTSVGIGLADEVIVSRIDG